MEVEVNFKRIPKNLMGCESLSVKIEVEDFKEFISKTIGLCYFIEAQQKEHGKL